MMQIRVQRIGFARARKWSMGPMGQGPWAKADGPQGGLKDPGPPGGIQGLQGLHGPQGPPPFAR